MSVRVQFALTPDFSNLVFSDQASVAEPLVHVLRALGRPAADQALVDRVVKHTGSGTVGGLRRLTDRDWQDLELPAMCRVYLKHAVRQSGRRDAEASGKTFIESLQDDFNFGMPFDISLYENSLAMLAAMGFGQEEALEALLITENKGIEGALEILFNRDQSVRSHRRKEAVERLNRRVPEVKSDSSDPSELASQVASLRRDLDKERKKREKIQNDVKAERANVRVLVYREFVRGLTASKSISVGGYEAFENYRRDKNISQYEHDQTLDALGLGASEFDDMKQFEVKKDNECVVCLEKEKDHVVFPCMHLCLCEDCAPGFGKGQSCPICNVKVAKVERIFR